MDMILENPEMMLSCMSMLGIFLIAISSIGIQYDNNCSTWKKGAPSEKRRKANKIFLIVMLICGICPILMFMMSLMAI